MARAEGMVSKKDVVRTCLDWAMISLVPLRPDVLTEDQRSKWKRKIVPNARSFERLSKKCPIARPDAVLPLSDRLRFKDPDRARDFDLLLVALTAPTPPFPTPSEIARAMSRDGKGLGVEYFEENWKNEIRTFQDRAIRQHLQRK